MVDAIPQQTKVQPGILDKVVGSPVDATTFLLNSLGANIQNPAFGSKWLAQNFGSGGALDQTLQQQPSDLYLTDVVKGLGRGVRGLEAGVSSQIGETLGDIGTGAKRLVTETVGERGQRLQEEKFAETLAKLQNAQVIEEGLRSAREKYFASRGGNGDGLGQLLAGLNPTMGGGIPKGGISLPIAQTSSPAATNLGNIISGLNFVPESGPEGSEGGALLRGLLRGSLGVDGKNIGSLLAAIGLGGAEGLSEFRKEKKETDVRNKKGKQELELEKGQQLLSLEQYQESLKEKNTPKLHNTASGLVVESRVKGKDGKERLELKQFSTDTFDKTLKLLQLRAALGRTGLGDVDILGKNMKLDRTDPFAPEQFILGQLQANNLLQTVFAPTLNSSEFQEIELDTRTQMAGAPEKTIGDEILRRKIAALSVVLRNSPELQKTAFELLGEER